MTVDAANPRFGSVARLSFGMPKNAVKPTFRPRKSRSTQGGDNPLPMVADWEILSKSEVREALGLPTSRSQNRGLKLYNTHQVVIICPCKAYYYDFFVNLQLVRGDSIQDIREKEEALCLSCT